MYRLSENEVLAELDTTRDGLSSSTAKNRLAMQGKNIIEGVKPTPKWKKFLYQFKDLLIIILIISAIVSLSIAIYTKNSEDFIDAGVILFVVTINAIVGFIQENKADADMEKLKNMTKPFCYVIRDKKTIRIPTEDLVTGDIVVLEAGNIIPADLRIIESAHIKIEESAITGESVPVDKISGALDVDNLPLGDRTNMAYLGTVVTYGRGLGVVVATGKNTEMGKIASALGENKPERTILQRRIDKTSKIISISVLIISVIIFLLYTFAYHHDPIKAFVVAISIAVSAIPEALPASVTITTALGVKRMSKKRAIVRRLSSIESLGNTEIICSDKTGTLTLNKMTVKRVYNLNGETDDTPTDILIRCMLLCNDTKSTITDETINDIGDPTETALVSYARTKNFEKSTFDQMFPRINEIPFDSERKLMTTINMVDGVAIAHTKGAVDNILVRCNKILSGSKVIPLTEEMKMHITDINFDFCKDALRVLGYAVKTLSKDPADINLDDVEHNMTFVGLSGMIDPPREEVKASIKECRDASIMVSMITGDHKDTAFAIAKELGIANKEDSVITGAELSNMSDEDLINNIFNYHVFARVSPEHKVRIVKAYQAHNLVCAMTGDGVNDAPSLRAANVSIGMGITGTDVTKDVSDIILTDDNFATITGAVKEGRTIYQNILNIVQYLMQTCMTELILLGIIVGIMGRELFSPALLLWNNFVSDCFPALALGVEGPSPNIMKRPPNTSKKNLFSGVIGLNILVGAVIQSILIGLVYFLSADVWHLPQTEVITLTFLALALVEIFHVLDARNSEISLFKLGLFSNKMMILACFASVGLSLLLILVPIPVVQSALNLGPLNGMEWLFVLGISISIIPIFEVYKLIKNLYFKHKAKKQAEISK